MTNASIGTMFTRSATLTLLAALALAATGASAADWPTFKPGRWQYDRNIDGMGPKPQKVSRTECGDPTANHKKQQAQLTQAGCQFTPITQSGSTYQYAASCKVAGMTSQSRSTLVVQGAEAYTLTVDSSSAEMKTHEVLLARRLGDCP